MFLNEGLVMFDNEIEFFLKKATQPKVKTSGRILQLVWNKI